MTLPDKSFSYICAFKAPNGLYVRVPKGGGVMDAMSNGPDEYSTFFFSGENQLITSQKFPDLYVGCTADTGLLTTVDKGAAVPFTLAQDGTAGEAASTMTGRMMATAGKYKNQFWYFLGGFQKNQIQMIADPQTPPNNPNASIFVMKIIEVVDPGSQA